ncbi:MAG: hypothetical protein ACLQAT_24900 [Candidatus Binataceae bacterium]
MLRSFVRRLLMFRDRWARFDVAKLMQPHIHFADRLLQRFDYVPGSFMQPAQSGDLFLCEVDSILQVFASATNFTR